MSEHVPVENYMETVKKQKKIFPGMFSELGNNDWHQEEAFPSLCFLSVFSQLEFMSYGWALGCEASTSPKGNFAFCSLNGILLAHFAVATTDIGDACVLKYPGAFGGNKHIRANQFTVPLIVRTRFLGERELQLNISCNMPFGFCWWNGVWVCFLFCVGEANT